MKLATGVDLIEIDRIQAVLARHGSRYLERVFTPAEREACKGRPESLAVRFAAKEAVAKALGTGIGEISWQEVEILNDEQQAPQLILSGSAAERAQLLGLTTWSVSLSHNLTQAIALVVGVGQ
jgi:holo-[acyl-carrier protein] synthase